jgi:glutathione S-transferase
MLREKGVSYTRRDIDLKAKPAWFAAISPRGKVPVLVADGVPLFESAAICEFIDETHAPRMLPDDPFERARQRAWVELASDLLMAQYKLYVAPTADEVAKAVEGLRPIAERFEEALAAGTLGRGFGLVEVSTAPALFRFAALEELTRTSWLAPWPRLEAWAREIAGRPSVRGTVVADFPAQLRAMMAERGAHVLEGTAA